MDKLKPCPFCGCKILLLEPYLARKGWEATIQCNGCPAAMSTITYDTETEAIKAVVNKWNRRVGE